MQPAPRGTPDGAHDLPRDLLLLQTLYRALPLRAIRWQTNLGNVFLDALFVAMERHQTKDVAAALGTSPQALYYMLERPRPAHPRAWPTPEDLRDINSLYRLVRAAQAKHTPIRRTTGLYALVHEALSTLLERYDLQEIALAMGLKQRDLKRFLALPLGSPEALARAIQELLPPPPGQHPVWRE